MKKSFITSGPGAGKGPVAQKYQLPGLKGAPGAQ